MSYDLSTTPRLHAKAWVFHRHSGFFDRLCRLLEPDSLSPGHRGRVERPRTAARNPDVLAKFGVVFDSYWSNSDFVPYDVDQFVVEQQRTGRTDSGPHVFLSPIGARFRFSLDCSNSSRYRGTAATIETCSSPQLALARP